MLNFVGAIFDRSHQCLFLLFSANTVVVIGIQLTKFNLERADQNMFSQKPNKTKSKHK